MKRTCVDVSRCARRSLVLAATCFCVILASNPGSTLANEPVPEGRLDFEAAKLPAANLEIDLSQDTFRSLFGISDAAIAGVAETLFKSGESEKGKSKNLSAEQLDAVRKIVELSGKFVREVRVRAYESLPENTDDVDSLLKPLDGQLKAGKWETVVRMRSDDDMLRVAVLQKDGSIRGLFVAATNGDEIAVVNIVCDISPDRIKPLTAAIAKIGMSAEFQPIVKWTISQTSDSSESSTEIALQNAVVAKPSSSTAAVSPKETVKKK
jgi:hypothetical protein